MKLARAQINNFRSVSDLTIDFEYACQGLIGINESGKSNILRALNLLDPAVSLSPADLRIERHNEPQVSAGYVRFLFRLEDNDIKEITEQVAKHFCSESLGEALVFTGSVKLAIKDYCQQIREGIYQVDIPSGKRVYTTWARPISEALTPNWYKNKTDGEVTIELPDGRAATVPSKALVWAPDGLQLGSDVFDKAELKDITSIHSSLIRKRVEEDLPACIFWKYADKYLLPSSIEVAAFCADPNSCVPLKSMFELAGYDAATLSDTISKAQAQGHHRYVHILEKTAAKATKHIRSVWNDNKSVRIKLESHGPSLAPIIIDDVVPLDMANRSDGFKRFVSFLLQISAKVRTEELAGALILIDEPEIALHPSGAKNLLRELIEIGNSNTVVFSTHSIFMIDKSEIGRHLVVEKKNEITTTWRAEKSRIQDEEVLYSAMGFSIFEALKLENVIFEGWRDKRLFEIVAANVSKSDEKIRNRISQIGFTFADGVKDIRNVAHFLELASRGCLIISDADKVALQHQNSYQTPGAWGEWKTLQEVLPGTSVVTGEDLVVRPAVIKKANKFRGSVEGLTALTEDFFNAGEATVTALRRWLEGAGLTGKELDEALNNLKSAIFVDLKWNELSEETLQLVKFVANYDFATLRLPKR